MFVQYSVKNYKSIKEEVIINFSATDKNVAKNLVIDGDEATPLYKAIGLVGPNACGKSNILDSIFFSLKFINSTIKRKESAKINVERFMLDIESKKDDASFEFIFIESGVKYVYGFYINEERIMEEYLLAYYTKKATTIFDRDVNREEEYNFKGNDVKIQVDISQKTNPNRLYMPVAAEWGYEKAKIPYKWFEKMFKQYGNMNTSLVIEDVVKNESKKGILLDALKKADFNIVDIFVKNRKMEKQQREALLTFLTQFLGDGEIEQDLVPEDRPIIWVKHKAKNGEEFALELDDDSAGTRDIIDNIAEFLYVSDNGGLIIEDEMGRNYHRKLTEYFINLFNDKIRNEGNAQMIFSTHDTKVLNLLRPEQIYLVDKDEDGATYVKLLDDYLIREKDNIELGYLKGRYGAIPNIKE